MPHSPLERMFVQSFMIWSMTFEIKSPWSPTFLKLKVPSNTHVWHVWIFFYTDLPHTLFFRHKSLYRTELVQKSSQLQHLVSPHKEISTRRMFNSVYLYSLLSHIASQLNLIGNIYMYSLQIAFTCSLTEYIIKIKY